MHRAYQSLPPSRFQRDFGTRNPKTGKYGFSANMLLALNFPVQGAAATAALSSGFIGDRIGRRAGLALMAIFAIVGPALQLSATSIGQIIGGKVVTGMATGFASETRRLFAKSTL